MLSCSVVLVLSKTQKNAFIFKITSVKMSLLDDIFPLITK